METETHFEKSRLVVCCSADEIFIRYEEWILWIIQSCKCIWPIYIITLKSSIFCIMMMIDRDQTLKKRVSTKKCGKKCNHNLSSAWKILSNKKMTWLHDYLLFAPTTDGIFNSIETQRFIKDCHSFLVNHFVFPFQTEQLQINVCS